MTIPSVPPSQTPWPVCPGNIVTPWVDGVAFYGRLLAATRGATSSVWGVLSFVHRDFAFPDGTLLWDAFDAAAAQGVDVRLLCWRNTSVLAGAWAVEDFSRDCGRSGVSGCSGHPLAGEVGRLPPGTRALSPPEDVGCRCGHPIGSQLCWWHDAGKVDGG